MKRTIALLLVLVLALALIACVGGTGNNPLVGKWNIQLSDDEQKQLDDLGIKNESGVEFTADGKYRFYFGAEALEGNEMEDITFDYKVNGNQITIEGDVNGKKESTTGTYKIDGDVLTMTMDGESQQFRRVK